MDGAASCRMSAVELVLVGVGLGCVAGNGSCSQGRL